MNNTQKPNLTTLMDARIDARIKLALDAQADTFKAQIESIVASLFGGVGVSSDSPAVNEVVVPDTTIKHKGRKAIPLAECKPSTQRLKLGTLNKLRVADGLPKLTLAEAIKLESTNDEQVRAQHVEAKLAEAGLIDAPPPTTPLIEGDEFVPDFDALENSSASTDPR